MAPLPEDDVPTMTGAPPGRPVTSPPDDESDDVTTTAEAGPPVRAPRRLPARAPPPPPIPMTQRLPSSSPPPPPGPTDDDPLEDSITTMAPRLAPSFPGMAIPVSVAIHTIEDDELDETKVRKPMSPRPAAGVPSSRSAPSTELQTENDDDDDGVTAEAIAPRGSAAPERVASLGIVPNSAPVTEQQVPTTQVPTAQVPTTQSPTTDPTVPTRPGVVSVTMDGVDEPLTRPGGDPTTLPGLLPRLGGYANDADVDEEDLTTRDAATDIETLEEEIVTTVGAIPKTGPVNLSDATLDDSTEGTTKNVRTVRKPDAPPLPPAPLPTPLADDDDELEPPENKTAVMANAPLQRIIAELTGEAMPIASSTGASAPPRRSLASESGLRLAGPSDPASGVARAAPPIDPRPYAATEAAFTTPPPPQPSVHDVDLGKGPSYGLLVAIVALISIVVPVTLFVVLKGRTEEQPVSVGVPAAAVPDLQQHDTTARGKAEKKPAASASASAAPSAKPPRPRR